MTMTPGEHAAVHLREFIERIIEERDRQYSARFDHLVTMFNREVNALKELTEQALDAMREAVIKAEQAQREYNIRSNEFRGQLDDQNKLMMSRSESMGLFKVQEDKLYSVKGELEIRMISAGNARDKQIENIIADIKSLRESRSEGGGARTALVSGWNWLVAAILLLIAIATYLAKR
jgi:hypothetical protein